MEVKAVDTGKLEKYIPVVFGEREKAEAQSEYAPLTFHLRQMTEREAARFGNDFAFNANGQLDLVDYDMAARIVFMCAERVDNLTLATPSGNVTISSGKDLANHRDELPAMFKHVYKEVAVHVLASSMVTETEAKN